MHGFALLALLLATPQNGDVKGEEQPPLRAEWSVPTPRPLSAEEELATFKVAPGLRVELVACEPLVRDLHVGSARARERCDPTDLLLPRSLAHARQVLLDRVAFGVRSIQLVRQRIDRRLRGEAFLPQR